MLALTSTSLWLTVPVFALNAVLWITLLRSAMRGPIRFRCLRWVHLVILTLIQFNYALFYCGFVSDTFWASVSKGLGDLYIIVIILSIFSIDFAGSKLLKNVLKQEEDATEMADSILSQYRDMDAE